MPFSSVKSSTPAAVSDLCFHDFKAPFLTRINRGIRDEFIRGQNAGCTKFFNSGRPNLGPDPVSRLLGMSTSVSRPGRALQGQVAPEDISPQNVNNAGKTFPVGMTWPTSFGFETRRRNHKGPRESTIAPTTRLRFESMAARPQCLYTISLNPKSIDNRSFETGCSQMC